VRLEPDDDVVDDDVIEVAVSVVGALDVKDVRLLEHASVDQERVGVPQWDMRVEVDPKRPGLIPPGTSTPFTWITLFQDETPSALNCSTPISD
jgi:hypothetical protein